MYIQGVSKQTLIITLTLVQFNSFWKFFVEDNLKLKCYLFFLFPQMTSQHGWKTKRMRQRSVMSEGKLCKTALLLVKIVLFLIKKIYLQKINISNQKMQKITRKTKRMRRRSIMSEGNLCKTALLLVKIVIFLIKKYLYRRLTSAIRKCKRSQERQNGCGLEALYM